LIFSGDFANFKHVRLWLKPIEKPYIVNGLKPVPIDENIKLKPV